mmetsp:Transcript_23904/g.57674  ORF Transcript_23904/g.57674 Transcript_23904/m.57674 type:complete len:137 (-) Transcript_23904:10-420(-)
MVVEVKYERNSNPDAYWMQFEKGRRLTQNAAMCGLDKVNPQLRRGILRDSFAESAFQSPTSAYSGKKSSERYHCTNRCNPTSIVVDGSYPSLSRAWSISAYVTGTSPSAIAVIVLFAGWPSSRSSTEMKCERVSVR